MKLNIDAVFLLDDDYHLEGVATAYNKLGFNCLWWEPSKKPFFDLMDECNPKVVYYSARGLAKNGAYLREAEKHLNLRDIRQDYPGIYANDLLYCPGSYDAHLASEALMIVKAQLNESQLNNLFKIISIKPKLKIISKKYIPVSNLIGACDLGEIRDAIASTKMIIDYDDTFLGIALYYGIECQTLDGDLYWGMTDSNKPQTFIEAVRHNVSNSG